MDTIDTRDASLTDAERATTHCLCCGGTDHVGLYLDRPCCDPCYRTGKLLECLDKHGNWKVANETDWLPPKEE